MAGRTRPSIFGAAALAWLVWTGWVALANLRAEGYLDLGYQRLTLLAVRDVVVAHLPFLVAGLPALVVGLRRARHPAGLAALLLVFPVIVAFALLAVPLNDLLRPHVVSRGVRAAALGVIGAGAIGIAVGFAALLARTPSSRRMLDAAARAVTAFGNRLQGMPGLGLLTSAFVGWVVVAIAAVGVLAPTLVARTRPTGPSFVIVLVDTLRADHLGFYGYTRPTSPRLDAWAEGAIVFENAIAQAAWTKPSVASLFTSLYPSVHATGSGTNVRRIVEADTLRSVPAPDEAPRTVARLPRGLVTMAEVFRNAGYRTVGLVANSLVSADDGYGQGFEVYETLGDRDITREARTFLRAAGDHPFFLYLHYMAPHAPYDPPERFDLFSQGNPRIDIHGSATKDSINFTRTLELTPEMLSELIAQYDGEIRFADASVGEVLDVLDETGLSGRAVVVLTADHGEEFLDHGMVWHEPVHLYPELVRIPLAVRMPDAPARRVDTAVMHIDLGPTLFALAGIENAPPGQGRSFADVLTGADEPGRPAFSEALDWGRVEATWVDPMKLLYDHETPSVELYDYRADPREERDLSTMQPDARAALLDTLIRQRDRNQARAGQLSVGDQELDPGQLEKLRSLGYVQ